MASLKEIRRRITSVKNTKQITRAMKLVSAAKLRRAQEAALGGRDFSRRLEEVLNFVSENLPSSYSNPLLQEAEKVTCKRVIFIAGERGLCGAYNTNLFKAVEALKTSAELEFVPIGRRSCAYARSKGWKISASYEGLPEDASLWPIGEIIEKQVQDFLRGEIQEVILFYTEFVTAMTQNIKSERLLPFKLTSGTVSKSERQFKFDSSPEVIVYQMIPLLISTKLTQAALDSKASEHASRMTAMDSATRNADDLIDRLRLFYNRARQSAITTELIDIVGGAEAQK